MSSTSATSRNRRRLLSIVVAIALVVFAVVAIDWLAYRFTHSISKDAFIESHLINVAPQVAGDIVGVYVQEQMPVIKGQLLAVVDPSTYRREVDLSSAKLGVAEATLARADADLNLLKKEVPKRITIAQQKRAIADQDREKAVAALAVVTGDVNKGVTAAEQAVEGAKATLVLASEDYKRYGALYQDQSVSERRFQEATKIYKNAQADMKIAQARLGQAQSNLGQIAIAEKQLRAAERSVDEAMAAVELAELGFDQIKVTERIVDERRKAVAEAKRALDLAEVNLGYTQVTAPYDGVIAKKWRHKGDYARTGDPIFSMYNPALLYVTVQLEETLLEGVSPGNYARLDVDAYRQPFRGRVIWIGSATGANFSLIPRDISSGEFTYVVQRVPTRIAIERDERWPLLKPGLSVRVSIDHGPGDAAWAAEALRQEALIEGIPEKQP
ncbi:MAG: HlyD family secretion protein [Gemmataceae bacterium]|nr:HlyD family secretion protein [Gemmataceae bacterium]